MESVKDFELNAFFTYVIDGLEKAAIPYMVVGRISVAMGTVKSRRHQTWRTRG